MVRPGKKAREGLVFEFGDGRLKAEVLSTTEGGNRLVRFHYDGEFYSLLEEIGNMPLPHYITAELERQGALPDCILQGSGFCGSSHSGSALHQGAAGTHVSRKGVGIAYVTLHVGLGTFRPVKTEEITDHQMHSEHYYITPETAEKINPHQGTGRTGHCGGNHQPAGLWNRLRMNRTHRMSARGDTSIFIYPGYQFKVLDGPDHQLPSARKHPDHAGVAHWRVMSIPWHAYKEAVEKKFRFSQLRRCNVHCRSAGSQEVRMYKLIKKQEERPRRRIPDGSRHSPDPGLYECRHLRQPSRAASRPTT